MFRYHDLLVRSRKTCDFGRSMCENEICIDSSIIFQSRKTYDCICSSMSKKLNENGIHILLQSTLHPNSADKPIVMQTSRYMYWKMCEFQTHTGAARRATHEIWKYEDKKHCHIGNLKLIMVDENLNHIENKRERWFWKWKLMTK